MKTIVHNCMGTCSRQIVVTINDDDTIEEVRFVGGCHGNTQGISQLVRGMKADDVVAHCTAHNVTTVAPLAPTNWRVR